MSLARAWLPLATLAALAALASAGDPPRLLGPYDAECQVAWHPDGKALAVTLRGGSAALIDPATGKRLARFRGDRQEGGSALAFDATGGRLAVATAEGQVRVYEVPSGKELCLISHGAHLRSVAFCAEGKSLITGGDLPERPEDAEAPEPVLATACVWDAATGAKLLDVDGGSKNPASGVAGLPASHTVAVVRQDGHLGLYDLAAKKRVVVELGEPCRVVAFSPDGKLLAALGGKDGAELTLVDARAGKVLRTLGKRADPATPALDGAVAFSPDGKRVARAQRGAAGVALFEVESGERKALEVAQASSLAFSPDGKRLAVGLRAGKVQVLDLGP